MSPCTNCGASVDSGWQVCRYCGAVTQTLTSAAEELSALEELNQVGMKLARDGAGVLGALSRNMSENMGGASSIARFWQNAFIPRTLEAQSQAMLQVFKQVVVPEGPMESMQFAMSSGRQKSQSIFLTRGETILTAMRVQHAGNSEASPRIAVLESELERARQKVRSARRKGWMVYALLMIGGLGILGCGALITGGLG
jgi:hypothetical protein